MRSREFVDAMVLPPRAPLTLAVAGRSTRLVNEIHVELEIQPEGAPEPLHLPVLRLDGREHIGRLYEFDLEVRHPNRDEQLDIEKLLTQRATITFSVKGTNQLATVKRVVRGVVVEAEDGLEADGPFTRTYKLMIRPPLSDLERFVSQEIFVGTTYPDVVKAKLENAQFAANEMAFRLKDPGIYGDGEGIWGDAAPDTLEQGRLVVQHGESDLAFISRLMEHVGVSFFFEDDGERELIVFADHTGGFAERSAVVPWKGDGEDHGVTKLKRRVRSIKSDFYVYDYNYRTPTVTFQKEGETLFDVLGGDAHLDVPSAGASFEFASNAKTSTEAELLAKVRAEEEESRRERYEGESVESSLFAGVRFKLDGHADVAEDDPLLVVSIVHTYRDAASFESCGEDKPSQYSNSFDAVRTVKLGPKNQPMTYRPERRTPKPRIYGVVTGVIQALADNQLRGYQHIDAQGRYIVKLHFDQGLKVMPRMRMAQPHAGGDYGHHFPIRPGCEVVVGFLNGDPDRPIILGAVPNPVRVSPVVAAKSQEPLDISRIKTRSGVIIEISDGPTTR